MTISLLMYDKGLERIGERLGALGLDVVLSTFDRDCTILTGGEAVSPESASFDYVWLSTDISRDGIIGDAFALMERLKSVDVLQTFNAGLDHPFYKRMVDKGTRVANSSAQGIAIAEYTLGQVMSVLQPIEEQRAMQARREWKLTPFREISETHWLVLGYGPIGRAITRRVKAFDARVTVVRRSMGGDGVADAYATAGDLYRHVGQADVVVVACPLTSETRGMVGAKFFSHMKAGTILVNVARGGLIEDEALLAALDSGQVATAILDVFATEPLPPDDAYWGHPRVRLTSHTSFSGSGVGGRWDALFLDNISRYAKGEPLQNIVAAETLA
ncbi:MAG: NAD(P)-dependent oxidoreductase [Hyphomicrobiaceae bacterium]